MDLPLTGVKPVEVKVGVLECLAKMVLQSMRVCLADVREYQPMMSSLC